MPVYSGMWPLNQQFQAKGEGFWNPPIIGCQTYTTAGTYSWVVPAGITRVSVVTVGGGSAGRCGTIKQGGGGGALAYVNNISVTPGETLGVIVGAGGTGSTGGDSSFKRGCTTLAGAGGGSFGIGGAIITGTGGAGGAPGSPGSNASGTGGGGAGGYSGAGGAGGTGGNYSSGAAGSAGTGGAGGGGGGGGFTCTGSFEISYAGSGGGGVGIYGAGTSGAGGAGGTTGAGGGGGGGSNGSSAVILGGINAGTGGTYGGGGGGGGISFNISTGTPTNGNGGNGAVGAVRIVWPGCLRLFPSTNVGA